MLLAANPIVIENQLSGTPQSQWDVGAGDPNIQGYATDISIDQGETIKFKVNDPLLVAYRLDIYRLGYYGGLGARKVDTVPSTQTLKVNQPAPRTDASLNLVDAGNWQVTAQWTAPTNATSGIYIANIIRQDTGSGSQMVFIVRNDDGRSEMLFQTSDTTWQAYNSWGGNSLYGGANGRFADKVSYNRPFATRSTVNGRDFVFGEEYPMVRWLEANGYDVSYFTGVDADRRGQEILEHKVYLSVGHDEYWSGLQRTNVEAARDAGVNLSFFSGNEVYWKVRWETSIDGSGTPYRTMVCYKETLDNAKSDPSPEWTGTWRDPRFSPPSDGGRPENGLTGTLWTVNRGPGGETGTSFNVPSEYRNMRFWRNTAVAQLQPGQTAVLGNQVLGYEWDEDVDNGFRPSGLVRMSSTTQTVPEKMLDYGSTIGVGTATHSLTLYRAKSGALVFGAGTVQWSWGLDGVHDGPVTPPDPSMRQATVNLFADMGVQPATLQPGLIPALPSTDVTAPVSVITSPVGGANLRAGVPVTITGTASDGGGGVVGGVEVSTDGGITWFRATGWNTWTYTWVPSSIGPTSILARAADDSGNIEVAPPAKGVTVGAQATSTTGLVGAWSFNATSGTTANDSSGRGNNGTVLGATWGSGVFGNALVFDGISNWVTVPDAASLDLTNGVTIEAWVRPTSLSGWTSVALKEQAGGLAYGLYASDDANRPPAGYVNTQGADRGARGNAALSLNSWVHLATTYDGSAVNLYLNGVFAGSQAASGNILTTNGALRFGGNAPFGEFFRGTIDEIRVYNRALNAGEISVDMSTPIGGTIETTAPAVSIIAPSGGASVSNTVTVSANASDNVAVAGVQFLLNGQPLGTEDLSAPYTLSWDTKKYLNGTYTLTARARDIAGNTSVSAPITVTVANAADVTPPTIELRYPAAGTKVAGKVPLWATASDNIGVQSVQFKANGVNLGPALTAAPYRMVWDATGLPNGSYTIVAEARDASGNVRQSTAVVIELDSVAPTVVSRSPATGAQGVKTDAKIDAVFSESIIAGTAAFQVRDSGNNLVAGAVTYNDASKTLTFTPAQQFNLAASYNVTVSGVMDLSGNLLTSPVTWSFTTSNQVVNASLWGGAVVPETPSVTDTDAVELGLRFRTDINGYITGIRFYKGGLNTGIHVGHLWDSAGNLLATATFINESATGWQQVNFATPVAVTAGTTYVVSYYAPSGGYATDADYFATAGLDNGRLHAPASTQSAGNGLYSYGGGFPNSSFRATNYWVDVVFNSTLADVVPPAVAGQTPPPGATNVFTSGYATVTFSEPVVAGSYTFTLRDASNNVVPATVTYDASTRTVTLVPNAGLAPRATYTASISGARDDAGNAMQPVSWSFTTDGPDTTAPSILNQTPTAGQTNVAPAGTIAVTFNESVRPTSISLTVLDQNNQPVPATVLYNDATHTATFNPIPATGLPPGCCGACSHCPLATGQTFRATLSGVQDLAGNTMPTQSWTFTTASLIAHATLWASSATPATASVTDATPVEVGLKFRANTDGFISGVRFYKGALNTGTHTGHLWDAGGNLLGTTEFFGETASGWQEVQFGAPIFVAANTTYVISYFAPNGGYAVTNSYFSTAGVTNGPLSALSNAAAGGNGVYGFGSGGIFPTTSSNGGNYWVDVVFDNTILPDTAPPQVSSKSPTSGATGVGVGNTVSAMFNEPVQPTTISMVLRNAQGTVVPAGVAYDTATRTVTLDPNADLSPGVTYTVTLSGALDTAGNAMAPVNWSFTTEAPVTGATIWAPTTTPAVAADSDTAAIELGVKFQANVNGFITGIRFYKGTGNTGAHVGHLWSSTGTLLATATFGTESATGWQQVNFTTPVAVTAGATYVASYYAPVGRYSANTGYFASAATTRGPLTALASSPAGGNGVYRYGTGGGFPTSSFQSTNYWVDVVFANTIGADTTPPAATATSPTAGATGVAVGSNLTATFNEPVLAGTVSLVLRDASNAVVAGTLSYDSATRTVTLDPTALLAPGMTYTATLGGAKDAAGNVMTTLTWSFTAAAPISRTTIFSSTTIPAIQADSDTDPIEVGVKFQANTDGYITGIRFYKGTGNAGSHLGHLWSSTGTLLGTVTFVTETATGWQEALFASPLAISAGTTYVASYYAPVGHYSANVSFFASAGTINGPLTALSNSAAGGNGVYRYGAGGGFPTQSFNSSNYWVDVVFSNVPADVAPPVVTGASPAGGATGVATDANATATFSESVQGGTISFQLRDGANNAVAAVVNYDAATRTVTLNPNANLAPNTTYTATLSGAKDVAGNAMTTVTWSFTTRVQTLRQSTVTDFASGTRTGTIVSNASDGEVTLDYVGADDFTGTALGSGYSVSSWAADGGGPLAVTVDQGVLSVAGGQVLSTQRASGTGVEALVSFGATAFQYYGLATGFSSFTGNYWAMFATTQGDTLQARVNANGISQDVNLGARPSGFHLYKILPTATGFNFFIDGTLATSVPIAFPAGQQVALAFSAFSGVPQPSLQVDWARFTTRVPSGTFISGVFDAGATVQWKAATAVADLPPGTSLLVETSTSDAAGGPWSAWSALSAAQVTSPAGRFIRYRLTLATTDPAATPTVYEIAIDWV